LKTHNASVDQREKSRQRLTEYNKSKGVSIEILDTTTDEVLSYSSIRQASEALGCVRGTFGYARTIQFFSLPAGGKKIENKRKESLN
jgi:hypothetical protein